MQMAQYHRGCDITGADSTESVRLSVRILLSIITASGPKFGLRYKSANYQF